MASPRVGSPMLWGWAGSRRSGGVRERSPAGEPCTHWRGHPVVLWEDWRNAATAHPPHQMDLLLPRRLPGAPQAVPEGVGVVVGGDRPPPGDLSPHRMALGRRQGPAQHSQFTKDTKYSGARGRWTSSQHVVGRHHSCGVISSLRRTCRLPLRHYASNGRFESRGMACFDGRQNHL